MQLRKHIKRFATFLALGIVCVAGIATVKPQQVEAASQILKNKTFYVYSEYPVVIQSYYSDDKISQDKKLNWNGRKDDNGNSLGTIEINDVGTEYYNGKNCHKYQVKMTDVNVKNKTPYIEIRAFGSKGEGYYPVSARVTEKDGDNGCNVKANEYKQLEETLDASNRLFAYIGYSFTGTKMEVKFDQYKYNVSYDLNGGSGDSSVQTGTFTENNKKGFNLHGAPSRTGYDFSGWYCNRDGSIKTAGSLYYPNNWSTGHLLNSIVMTAQWKPKKYSISYNSNKPNKASAGVTGSMPSSTEFTYDNPQSLDKNEYKLKGWTFTGWNTKADGSGQGFSDGQEVTNVNGGTNTTLYAQWTANIYEIKFEKVAGENGTSFMYEKYDNGFYSDERCKNKITSISIPSKVNYKFDGYFEDMSRGGSTIVDASGNIKCQPNKFPNKIDVGDGQTHYDTTSTVYAYWIPNTYKITLDKNGGTGGTSAIYEWFGTGYYSDKNHSQGISSISIPTREGYKFGGYWTRQNEPLLESSYNYLVNGTQKLGSDGQLKTDPNTWGNRTDLNNTDFSENTTLYALWIPLEYTITLSSNDSDVYAHGTEKYTEVYGYYNYAEVPTPYTNGETQTDTVSGGYTGGWQTFTAPYTGEYTFKDNAGNTVKRTLKQGETIKIYNSTN